MNKLNLGCGQNKIEGYINVDSSKYYNPDCVLVLDDPNTIWPFETNSIDEVLAFHIIEHLGDTTEKYFHFIKELYRVCKHKAQIHVLVPHHRNDNFLHDPTHVRAITPHHFYLFSVEQNAMQELNGGRETKLGFYLGVDIRPKMIQCILESDIDQQYKSGQLTMENLQSLIRFSNNIVSEVEMVLEVIKEYPSE